MVSLAGLYLLLRLALDQPHHRQGDEADHQVRLDVFGCADEHWPGVESSLHLAELVLDLRQAVVLLDDGAVVHLQFGRDDLVVPHEVIELRELLVGDLGDELRGVQHLARLLVEDVALDESPEAFALRRSEAEAVRIRLEPFDEVEERLVLVAFATTCDLCRKSLLLTV